MIRHTVVTTYWRLLKARLGNLKPAGIDGIFFCLVMNNSVKSVTRDKTREIKIFLKRKKLTKKTPFRINIMVRESIKSIIQEYCYCLNSTDSSKKEAAVCMPIPPETSSLSLFSVSLVKFLPSVDKYPAMELPAVERRSHSG